MQSLCDTLVSQGKQCTSIENRGAAVHIQGLQTRRCANPVQVCNFCWSGPQRLNDKSVPKVPHDHDGSRKECDCLEELLHTRARSSALRLCRSNHLCNSYQVGLILDGVLVFKLQP